MCEHILLLTVTWQNNTQFTKLPTDTTYPTVPWKYREYTLKGNEQGRNRFKQEMNKKCTCINTRLHSHTLVCVGFDPLIGGVICLLHENRERWHWCDNETHPAAQTNSLSSQTDKSSESISSRTGPHREQHLSSSQARSLSLPHFCMSLLPHAPIHLPLTDHPLLSASTQLHYQTTANKDKMSSQLHSSDQSAVREEDVVSQ